jgi:hypothetical protein
MTVQQHHFITKEIIQHDYFIFEEFLTLMKL